MKKITLSLITLALLNFSSLCLANEGAEGFVPAPPIEGQADTSAPNPRGPGSKMLVPKNKKSVAAPAPAPIKSTKREWKAAPLMNR